MPNKKLPVPKSLEDCLANPMMECGADGIIRVKDGRSLEEYINDPRLVKARKEVLHGSTMDAICVDARVARAGFEYLVAYRYT